MINETKMAKQLLNAVYNEELYRVEELLSYGADPNWVFNGYPILIHAVNIGNVEIVLSLIKEGAKCEDEALGFALENGIGEVVIALAKMGVIPKQHVVNEKFGELPSRYCPISISYN